MKHTAVIFTIILFSIGVFGQPTNPPVKNVKKPLAWKNSATEKAELEKAVALADTTERIAALIKFVEDYPKSKEKNRALELVTSGRAALADEKLRAGEKADGIELFKLAVRSAPQPISDKLFTTVILQIPNSLFFRGEAAAAIETARLIEEKAEGNAKQLLALATFYLGMENAAEAKRLAGQAVLLEPNLPAAFQTLGLAHRLDFELEKSEEAYAKALELDATSIISKRGLAEMKRATGKTAEAVALYREIAASDTADAAAQTGLILALFDAENKTEAESELAKSLEANPNNLFLLVGAAYWYAAHNDAAKAVDLAEKAVNIEPRYTWARIALARGLMQQKRPLEAEKALLAARQYGDFPTLDYELAAARYQAGFYREASEILQKKFSITDGAIKSKLGGRVGREAKSFVELLAAERRASIFQTLAADNLEDAGKLKSLLDFSQKIETGTDEASGAAADEFVKGDDRMKIYRQLFAADQLLQKRKALPKIFELTKAAIGGVDAGLEAPSAAAAVLADELYQSRRLAIIRNELIVVPDVPRPTLSKIVRGRIEEITGWALFQENKSAEAVVRLKRAVSVLPEKSSYWRNATWRLGTAQDAAGNFKDALDAYIKSYQNGEADAVKYNIIETAYQKVNGSADGLEAKIGVKPASSFSAQNKLIGQPSAKIEAAPETKSEPAPTPATTPATIESPEPAAQPKTIVETSNSETTRLVENQEPKVEKTPTETRNENLPAVNNQTPENKPNPLFEPIVINVPKFEPVKKPTTETKTDEEKSAENAPPTETKADETDANDKSAKSIPTRPRLTNEKDTEPTPTCEITVEIVNRKNALIINDGGNLSVLVSLKSDAASNQIKATSSSPADIEVLPQPPADGDSPRETFFAVKSISPKTGMFTVTFESACGKEIFSIEVR